MFSDKLFIACAVILIFTTPIQKNIGDDPFSETSQLYSQNFDFLKNFLNLNFFKK